MIGRSLICAAFLGAVLGAAPAMAQSTQDAPCSSEAHRALDFWVGEWTVTWTGPEGAQQQGHNSISQTLDGCVIYEQFDGNPGNNLIGRSMSTYAGQYGTWKQVWMDNQGSYLPFSGGPDGDRFILTMDRASDEVPYLRMVFENITEDALDWRWQQSQDEGATWEDRWHLRYSRAE